MSNTMTDRREVLMSLYNETQNVCNPQKSAQQIADDIEALIKKYRPLIPEFSDILEGNQQFTKVISGKDFRPPSFFNRLRSAWKGVSINRYYPDSDLDVVFLGCIIVGLFFGFLGFAMDIESGDLPGIILMSIFFPILILGVVGLFYCNNDTFRLFHDRIVAVATTICRAPFYRDFWFQAAGLEFDRHMADSLDNTYCGLGLQNGIGGSVPVRDPAWSALDDRDCHRVEQVKS